jgi:phospholipid/cholesterol/gamma-HCH transport system substrate-binding protein
VKVTNEFKIGLVIVSAISFLFFGVNYLKGIDIFKTYTTFYAIYKNAEGINKSDWVVINGVKVGVVRNVKLNKLTKNDILIEFSVSDRSLKIPENSTALFRSRDLLGTKCIEIVVGDSQTFASDGDTLTSAVATSVTDDISSSIAPMKTKAESFFNRIDKNLDTTFIALNQTLRSITALTTDLNKQLNNNKLSLDRTFKNFEQISGNLASNSERLNRSIKNFESISDSLNKANLKQTIEETRKTVKEMQAVMKKINSGEGTMGKLVNDKTLYNNLNRLSADLDSLAIDFKKHPKRYVHFSVFGKNEKK